MRKPNNPIFTDVPVVTNTVTSSLPIDVIDLEGFSIQLSFDVTAAGGLTGSVKLQGSLDRADQRSAAQTQVNNWALISGSAASFTIPSGSGTENHNILWNWPGVYFPWVRPVITVTAGTGSLNARFVGKGS